jgi:tetratricopeptide (TPR) repeat protein
MGSRMRPAAAAIAAALMVSAPVYAQIGGPDQVRHQACVEAIADDAEYAYEEALAWRSQGGGWPARHCVALALIALDEVEEGAARLQANAEGATGASDHTRAIMLGQAGEAWLSAGQPGEAAAAFERGLDFAPGDYGLALGVAEARLAGEDWERAEMAAGRAIAIDAGPAAAWRVRGEARLAMGRLDDAEADMRAGRERAPDEIDLLLLRGRINEARRES